LLATLAGSPPISGPLGELGEPVTATIIAMVPVLTLLLDKITAAYKGGSVAPEKPEMTAKSKLVTPETASDAADDSATAAIEAELEQTTLQKLKRLCKMKPKMQHKKKPKKSWKELLPKVC
jgi:hypothetical protein